MNSNVSFRRFLVRRYVVEMIICLDIKLKPDFVLRTRPGVSRPDFYSSDKIRDKHAKGVAWYIIIVIVEML